MDNTFKYGLLLFFGIIIIVISECVFCVCVLFCGLGAGLGGEGGGGYAKKCLFWLILGTEVVEL